MSKSAPPRHLASQVGRPAAVLGQLRPCQPLKRPDSGQGVPPPVQKTAPQSGKARSDAVVGQLIRLILAELVHAGLWVSQEQAWQLFVQLSKTAITSKSVTLSVFEQLAPTSTKHLKIADGSIVLDLQEFARLKAQGVMGQGESQVLLDVPEEIILDAAGGQLVNDAHKVVIGSAEVVVDGSRFLPLTAPHLLSAEQKEDRVPAKAELKFCGPELMWAVAMAICGKAKNVRQAKPDVLVDTTNAPEDVGIESGGKLIKTLFNVTCTEKPCASSATLILTAVGPSLQGQRTEIPQNPVRLFQNILLNTALFFSGGNETANICATFGQFFQGFFRHVSNNIAGELAISVFHKRDLQGEDAAPASPRSSGESSQQAFDDFLASLQCDFETDGDTVELKFDVSWYLEDYAEALKPLIEKLKAEGRGKLVRLGGELFKGRLEQMVIEELAAAGVERVERCQ